MRPPSQLTGAGFQFVKVLAGSKQAFEPGTPRYSVSDPEFIKHLDTGGNYGVVGDTNHLIIDADSEELGMIVRTQLPKTFTVTSATKQKPHFYYRCSWTPRDIALTDWTMEDPKVGNIGTVRGKGYVVGPFSNIAGRQYQISDGSPVAEVTEKQVLDVLLPWMAEKTATIDRQEWKGEPSGLQFPILSISGIREGGQVHPIHGSSSGSKNLHVDSRKNLWFCFACCHGGDSLQLLAVMNRVIGCWEAGPGGLTGDKFSRTKAIALREGMITEKQAIEATKKAKLQINRIAGQTAKELMKTETFLTFPDTGEILHYSTNPGVYELGAESLIGQTVESMLDRTRKEDYSSAHFVKEVQGHIARRTYTDRDKFDADLTILNLENGLFHLDTGELTPHTSAYPSMIQLPVTYDPAAKCPKIDKFLNQVVKPSDALLLQEMTGAILHRKQLQKAFMLNGSGGNGKGTFIRLVQRLIGDANTAARSLQELENDRFARADLFGKLANLCSELPETALKTTGSFKILTGGEPLTAQKKHGQPFLIQPFAKHIYSCNRIPKTPDDVDAFFRRWVIINFPNRFEGKTDNKNLFEELSTKEEISGFFNWAIQGLKRLQGNGWQFSDNSSIEEVRELWIRGSDPVKAFLMDKCKAQPDASIAKTKLYQAFVAYCQEKNLLPVSDPAFFRDLPRAGAIVRSAKLGPEGARIPSIVGLRLKTEEEATEDMEDGQAKL